MSDDNPDYYRPDSYADEDLVPFDPRDDNGRRAMWILLGIVLALIVAAIIAFNMYSSGTRDRGTTPLVTAEKTPFKVDSDEATREPVEDSPAYKAMKGETTDETIVPAPEPEEPLNDMPDSATIIVDGQTSEPEVVTPPPAKVETRPTSTVDSDHVVQVASVRSRAAAQDIWSKVEAGFGSNLPSGSYSDIKRVDLGSKGIYFRLRVAGLRDKSAADRLCTTFKARGQACFVTRK